ncbi:MAG: helix-turn-helix domain-containing protein [Actinobacteria bacterium]|nr:helix-turn-helix domain-containing protein [Actinomycetota bacterium]
MPDDDNGYGIVTKEFLRAAARDELTSTDKVVMVVLATFYNTDTGTCWPSYARIAEMARISRASVWTSLSRLKAKNYLRIESGQQNGDVNTYELNVNQYGALVGPFEDETRPGQETPPVQVTRQGDNEAGVQVTRHPSPGHETPPVQEPGHPPSRSRDTNNLIEESKENTKERTKVGELETLICSIPDFQFPPPVVCRQYDDILEAIAHCNPTLADDTLAQISRLLSEPAATEAVAR